MYMFRIVLKQQNNNGLENNESRFYLKNKNILFYINLLKCQKLCVRFQLVV